MKILAVIPARGGSKGIPRKNVRLMNGKPLIAYAVGNALDCPLIDDVAVSSDDDEILAIGERYGAVPLRRSSALAQDAVTLDPVIFDAVQQMEAKNGLRYDTVITLQPTSPLLSVGTLTDAVAAFNDSDCDTFISAVNKPHLAWTKDENGRTVPLYKERLNRQQLPPNYLEAGAFFITRREFVTENSRMGKNVSVYEMPEYEATDIDDVSDWITCESRLQSKTVVFRCDGHRKLGMGHVNRCLSLAYHLIGHKVIFVTREDWTDGLQVIKNSFFPCYTIKDDEDYFRLLADIKPDVAVNDCLDTSREYMLSVKKYAARVVTFEDMGEGAAEADAVINSLCEPSADLHCYYGSKYADLRDEFLTEEPVTVNDKVRNVLVMFGGTDPSNLIARIYGLAKKYSAGPDGLSFTFITDRAYDCAYHGIADAENIKIYSNVKRVSDIMRGADLAFTSQGRTVFELACLGVPTIVLAQNAREQANTFAQMQNGFINLGLGSTVKDDTIAATFDWLCSSREIREWLSRLMRAHDLKSGTDRVKDIILGRLV